MFSGQGNASRRRRAAVLALSAFVLLVFASPGYSAFPGRNGKIAYTYCTLENGCSIWTIDPTGGSPTQLTPSGQTAYSPAFSADGQRIVYTGCTADGGCG